MAEKDKPGYWETGGQFDQMNDLWREKYFPSDSESELGVLICNVCGALVKLGWKHISFHEGKDMESEW